LQINQIGTNIAPENTFGIVRKMKKLLLIPALVLTAGLLNAQSKLTVEGNYQGKNLYVQNPYASNNVGFCTIKVTVNGNTTSDAIESSAYEIDLSIHKLKVGDAVSVVIEHKVDCTPKVLNPEVLKPRSTYEIVNMNVDGKGKLTWKTKNENGKLPFVIEQYVWNKWIVVGEVDGKGTPSENAYEFQLTPHSGENKVRIKQVDYTGKPNPSQAKTFTDASVGAVDFNPKTVKDKITFTSKTRYEIYDSYGNIVKKGYANEVDCTNLKKGAYYINFDNKDSQFVKK
jgi:hypothetical protein